MTALFISDLHLDPRRPVINELFYEFLAGRAAAAEALYILGDLFEAWVGDDDNSPLARAVAARLRRLADAGVALFFIHGNRDFLLGPRYAAGAGLRLLDETTVVNLYGTPTLLMHGDTLCTDDLAYQEFRARVRSPQWQRRTLALPLFARRLLAARLRYRSRRAQRQKTAAVMDVNPDAVTRALRDAGVGRLIHGHTHRPGIHRLDVDGRPAERIVLGDWYQKGSVLVCDPSGCRLETLPA